MYQDVRVRLDRRNAICVGYALLLGSGQANAQDKPSLQERLEERLRRAADRLVRRVQDGASAPQRSEAPAPGPAPAGPPQSSGSHWRGRSADGVDLDTNETGDSRSTQILLNLQHLTRNQSEFWFFFGGQNGGSVNPSDATNPRRTELMNWIAAARKLDEAQQAEVVGRLARDFKGSIGYVSGQSTANRDFALSALPQLFPRATELRLAFSTRPRTGGVDPNGLPEFDKDPTKVRRVTNASIHEYLQADTASYTFSGRTLSAPGTPVDRGYTSPGFDDAMIARVFERRVK